MKTLSDTIEEFIPGDWGNETKTEETPNAVYCVRGADIVPVTNCDYENIPLRYVSDSTIETKLLQAGDIVIEKSGGSPTQSTGRVVYITEELIKAKGNLVCSNFCVAFRVKPEFNSYFVYQYWQFIYSLGVFFNFEGKTSGLKNLQLETAVASIPFLEKDGKDQNKVADLLTLIDRKIANNRKTIAMLETMAKQLYDYWFVQFDFPDADGKPYKSSGGKMVWNEKLKREIPEGWEVKKVEDILERCPTTKKFPSNEYLSTGKFPIFDQGTDSWIVGYTDDEENILKKYPAILFGDHSTCVKFINQEFARGADGTQIIYSNDNCIKQYYLYLSIKSLEIPNPGYSRHFKYLKELPIIKPDKLLADRFEEQVYPYYFKITEFMQEITLLSSLRDFLLPMLMNGQVTITPSANE